MTNIIIVDNLQNSYNTPVLLLIFNRPDTTQRVFECISKAAPPKLYIAADGPRPNKEGEAEKVALAKSIVEKIDWECEIKTLYRDSNLGCRRAVSSAIDWFFQHEEQGIILEDDCIPDPSFFGYCQQLLQHYKDDERVMHIGGVNFQDGIKRGTGSYYFTKYNHVWGWASWRRAWKHYDVNMKEYPEFKRENLIRSILSSQIERKFWENIFERVESGLIDTWDYQWTFAIWSQHGLCVTPNVNLISNIGFGENATHTKSTSHVLSEMNTESIVKIVHPIFVQIDHEADRYNAKYIYSRGLINKIKNIISELKR